MDLSLPTSSDSIPDFTTNGDRNPSWCQSVLSSPPFPSTSNFLASTIAPTESTRQESSSLFSMIGVKHQLQVQPSTFSCPFISSISLPQRIGSQFESDNFVQQQQQQQQLPDYYEFSDPVPDDEDIIEQPEAVGSQPKLQNNDVELLYLKSKVSTLERDQLKRKIAMGRKFSMDMESLEKKSRDDGINHIQEHPSYSDLVADNHRLVGVVEELKLQKETALDKLSEVKIQLAKTEFQRESEDQQRNEANVQLFQEKMALYDRLNAQNIKLAQLQNDKDKAEGDKDELQFQLEEMNFKVIKMGERLLHLQEKKANIIQRKDETISQLNAEAVDLCDKHKRLKVQLETLERLKQIKVREQEEAIMRVEELEENLKQEEDDTNRWREKATEGESQIQKLKRENAAWKREVEKMQHLILEADKSLVREMRTQMTRDRVVDNQALKSNGEGLQENDDVAAGEKSLGTNQEKNDEDERAPSLPNNGQGQDDAPDLNDNEDDEDDVQIIELDE